MSSPDIHVSFYDRRNTEEETRPVPFVPMERKIIRETDRVICAHDFQCNLRCIFCRRYHIKNRSGIADKLDGMIEDYFLPLCEGAKIVEMQCGGELFSSRHSRNLARRIAEQYPDIRFCIHSNGLLFNNKNYWRTGIAEKTDTVYIWINAASRKTYGIITRGGDYTKLLKNLRFLRFFKKTGKIKKLYFGFVVTEKNKSKQDDFVVFAEKYGGEPCFVLPESADYPCFEEPAAAPMETGHKKKSGPSFLLFPPTQGFGSFGDQAMIFALINRLKAEYPAGKIGILHYEAPDLFLNDYFPDLDNLHLSLEYGRTNMESIERYCDILENYTHVLLVGADNLDGAYNIPQVQTYLNLIRMAHKMKKKTTLAGFSYNANASAKALRYIREMAMLTPLRIRDAVSLKRLDNFDVKNLILVTDSAFLFNHKDYKMDVKTAAYIETLRRNNKKYVGLNIRFLKNDPERMWALIDKISTVLCKTIDKEKYAVVLIAHDIRDFPYQYSDTESLSFLGDALNEAGFTVYNPYWITTCIESKAIIELCDFVIGNRMHIAILALSMGIPVISFIYQGKFEGLYGFYDFKHLFLFEKDTFDCGELASAVDYIKENLSVLREYIVSVTKEIRILAERNFKSL
jgi:polysaccharide pyruvyl transferase WcaK-like protein